jgi:uncharacterized protein (DUF302 family)
MNQVKRREFLTLGATALVAPRLARAENNGGPKEAAVSQDLRVRHREFKTTQSFEQVVAAFENAVGSVENVGWPAIRSAAKDAADIEARVHARLGPSGFTRFLTIDHGDWTTFFLGRPAKARMYTIGNPLVAITMLQHDIAAGLNVPVRVMIYRDESSGTTRFVYDEPSTLMSGLHNAAVMAAAEKLDAKLAELAAQVTGAQG